MDAGKTTENNADLWTEYLHARWSARLALFGLADPATERATRRFAEAAAAGISSWLTMFVAQPIDAMFNVNAAGIDRFLDEGAQQPDSVEIPAQYAHDGGIDDPTQHEAWALAPEPAIVLVR